MLGRWMRVNADIFVMCLYLNGYNAIINVQLMLLSIVALIYNREICTDVSLFILYFQKSEIVVISMLYKFISLEESIL